MEEIIDIGKFDAAFCREGVVSLVVDNCVLCGEEKRCVYIDGSEGEYGGASVCGDCAKSACDSVADDIELPPDPEITMPHYDEFKDDL